MANEVKWVAGSEITLQNADGAAISNGAYQAATTANLTVANVAGYEYLSFESLLDWNTTGPTIGAVMDIYARALDFESTNDMEAPEADFQQTYVGSIPVNDVLTPQYYKSPPLLHPFPLADTTFYLANRTGQTLQANWTLKVTPMTRAPT